MKKAQLKTLQKLLLVVLVLFLLMLVLNKGFRNFYIFADSSFLESDYLKCQHIGLRDATLSDSDKDGLPDTCDPCVDIAEHLPYGGKDNQYDTLTNPLMIKSYDAWLEEIKLDEKPNYKFWPWKGKKAIELSTYFTVTDTKVSGDNDGDRLHDLCEWHKEMKWYDGQWTLYTTKTPVEKKEYEKEIIKVLDPKDDPEFSKCKFYYTEGKGCCSRPSTDNVKIKGISSKGIELQELTGKCIPYYEKDSFLS